MNRLEDEGIPTCYGAEVHKVEAVADKIITRMDRTSYRKHPSLKHPEHPQ